MIKITLPELSLVVLVGPSGAGKSTFARKHFKPTEVVSSDACRAMVSDDECNQAVSAEAFELLHLIAAKRLSLGKLTVIDATNVQPHARKPLVELARRYHCLPVAIVLDVPERVCVERNARREDRQFGAHVVRGHVQQMRRAMHGLEKEGFRHVFVLSSVEEVEGATVERQPLWCNLKQETGPFDIIGDVHGCRDELLKLLATLGYQTQQGTDGKEHHAHPLGRKAVFLGDLVDRGPDIPGVLKIVMAMVAANAALVVPGNHDMKLLKKLRGKDVKVAHGLAQSLEQLEMESGEFIREVVEFLDGLVSHYQLDGGRLVVAHAGMKESMQGRGSGGVREFALYGETTGELDQFGLPVRQDWAAEYRGAATVVYGHTPLAEAEWLNNTICVDTGCVFGGKLTALRYPERELVSVPAARVYCEPVRPLNASPSSALSAQQHADDVLDMEDVLGKRTITTSLLPHVTIPEENAAAALEAVSRFGVDPRWLIYLPPTMSPSETSSCPGMLEHPQEAFTYFLRQDVHTVVCQQKHMGSRAVMVVCKDAGVAQRRFGVNVEKDEAGICYSRTGRRFFTDHNLEAQVLQRVRAALDASGMWQHLNTDWVCLDCEIMPWSLKAQELLKEQYAAVGACARVSLDHAVQALEQAARFCNVEELLAKQRERQENARRFAQAYRRYCWPVTEITDVRVAPFHLLATEGQVHVDKTHAWHMDTLAKACAVDPQWLLATPHLYVNVGDDKEVARGIGWWEELTAAGGEGMVVKPIDFVRRGPHGLVQPAIKCRGVEYLRIIYGLEYTQAENLERLRFRGVGAKRSLALREFALGVEALQRFVARQPLRRVHQCVLGVLALESQPVDPRL